MKRLSIIDSDCTESGLWCCVGNWARDRVAVRGGVTAGVGRRSRVDGHAANSVSATPAGWQKHLGSRTLHSSSPAMRRILSTGQFIRRTVAGLFDERSKVICSLSVSPELSEIICRLMK